MSQNLRKLSPFPQASLAELAYISFSMTFLIASTSILQFFDRLFLAHFSPETLNAAVLAQAFTAPFQVAAVRMANTAQVFVGHSVSKKSSSGIYVWQMIWLSLFIACISLALGLYLENFFFDNDQPISLEARSYFHIFICGNLFYPLSAALMAFFSGQGKLAPVILASIGAHIINLSLDYLLIFSPFGLWAPMGIRGAAYAAIVSKVFLCSMLFILILRKKEREEYGTSLWKIDLQKLIRCIRLGLPTCILVLIISLSWMFTIRLIPHENTQYMLIIAVGNTIAVLFKFINLSFGQGLTIIASNILGAKRWEKIDTLNNSAIKMMSILLLFLAFPLLFFPHSLLQLILPQFPQDYSPELISSLVLVCRSMWFFECVGSLDRYARAILTAAGDTPFILGTYAILAYPLLYCPFFYIISVWEWPLWTFWPVMSLVILTRNIPLFWRLSQKEWKRSFLY